MGIGDEVELAWNCQRRGGDGGCEDVRGGEGVVELEVVGMRVGDLREGVMLRGGGEAPHEATQLRLLG